MAYRSDGTIFEVDQVMETKLDIGKAGAGGGLDVGEGGSYQTDGVGGAVIVKAFTMDASAPSGTRFNELDLNAQNTLLGDVGDRLYIGSPYLFWGFRAEIGVAKVGGTQILKFSEAGGISDVPSVNGMVVLKDSANSIGNIWLQQTVQKEYITQDRIVDSTWSLEDNILDVIPNTGTPLYWMVYEVPIGGWSTPPRLDEIKVRGSDFDIISGAAFSVYWGKARVEIHERIDLGEGSGGQSATLDLTSTLSFSTKKMRSGQADPVSRMIQLPSNIDTSCSIVFTIDGSASVILGAGNELDLTINIRKLKNGTIIGSGETSELIETTAHVIAAANTFYVDMELNTVTRLDISDMMAGDNIAVQLSRADSDGGDFYPITLSMHYIVWTTGEHV